jgi:hypothetical protein
VRLLTGGAELGAAAVRDPRVSLVHMTGSASTFQNVVRMLEGVEKSVFEGPFRIVPTPMWLPANRNPVGIARALLALYLRPSPARLPGLLVQALRG